MNTYENRWVNIEAHPENGGSKFGVKVNDCTAEPKPGDTVTVSKKDGTTEHRIIERVLYSQVEDKYAVAGRAYICAVAPTNKGHVLSPRPATARPGPASGPANWQAIGTDYDGGLLAANTADIRTILYLVRALAEKAGVTEPPPEAPAQPAPAPRPAPAPSNRQQPPQPPPTTVDDDDVPF